jgi:hypothetical protein
MNDSEIWKPKPQINNGGEPHGYEGLCACPGRVERLEADVENLRDALRDVTDDYAGLVTSDYQSHNNPDPAAKIESIRRARALLGEAKNG